MIKKHRTSNNTSTAWVQGEIKLAGTLDTRMLSLLKAIENSGSINQAAKDLGLSYKGTWQIIERANNFSPKALISTATGGRKGGGTSLTTAGQALLKLYTELEAEHKIFLQQINQRLESSAEMLLLLKPLTIKASATNQLFGTVAAIHNGGIGAEIFVTLKGGEQIVVSLTQSELELLKPKIEQNVLVIINSTDITLLTDFQDNRISARNCLPGTVIRIIDDGVDSEVAIRIGADNSIVAMITQVSAESLNLKLGVSAHAVFKSNAVILATGQTPA
jgi:molybdate transport system regulatory protein